MMTWWALRISTCDEEQTRSSFVCSLPQLRLSCLGLPKKKERRMGVFVLVFMRLVCIVHLHMGGSSKPHLARNAVIRHRRSRSGING